MSSIRNPSDFSHIRLEERQPLGAWKRFEGDASKVTNEPERFIENGFFSSCSRTSVLKNARSLSFSHPTYHDTSFSSISSISHEESRISVLGSSALMDPFLSPSHSSTEYLSILFQDEKKMRRGSTTASTVPMCEGVIPEGPPPSPLQGSSRTSIPREETTSEKEAAVGYHSCRRAVPRAVPPPPLPLTALVDTPVSSFSMEQQPVLIGEEKGSDLASTSFSYIFSCPLTSECTSTSTSAAPTDNNTTCVMQATHFDAVSGSEISYKSHEDRAPVHRKDVASVAVSSTNASILHEKKMQKKMINEETPQQGGEEKPFISVKIRFPSSSLGALTSSTSLFHRKEIIAPESSIRGADNRWSGGSRNADKSGAKWEGILREIRREGAVERDEMIRMKTSPTADHTCRNTSWLLSHTPSSGVSLSSSSSSFSSDVYEEREESKWSRFLQKQGPLWETVREVEKMDARSSVFHSTFLKGKIKSREKGEEDEAEKRTSPSQYRELARGDTSTSGSRVIHSSLKYQREEKCHVSPYFETEKKGEGKKEKDITPTGPSLPGGRTPASFLDHASSSRMTTGRSISLSTRCSTTVHHTLSRPSSSSVSCDTFSPPPSPSPSYPRYEDVGCPHFYSPHVGVTTARNSGANKNNDNPKKCKTSPYAPAPPSSSFMPNARKGEMPMHDDDTFPAAPTSLSSDAPTSWEVLTLRTPPSMVPAEKLKAWKREREILLFLRDDDDNGESDEIKEKKETRLDKRMKVVSGVRVKDEVDKHPQQRQRRRLPSAAVSSFPFLSALSTGNKECGIFSSVSWLKEGHRSPPSIGEKYGRGEAGQEGARAGDLPLPSLLDIMKGEALTPRYSTKWSKEGGDGNGGRRAQVSFRFRNGMRRSEGHKTTRGDAGMGGADRGKNWWEWSAVRGRRSSPPPPVLQRLFEIEEEEEEEEVMEEKAGRQGHGPLKNGGSIEGRCRQDVDGGGSGNDEDKKYHLTKSGHSSLCPPQSMISHSQQPSRDCQRGCLTSPRNVSALTPSPPLCGTPTGGCGGGPPARGGVGTAKVARKTRDGDGQGKTENRAVRIEDEELHQHQCPPQNLKPRISSSPFESFLQRQELFRIQRQATLQQMERSVVAPFNPPRSRVTATTTSCTTRKSKINPPVFSSLSFVGEKKGKEKEDCHVDEGEDEEESGVEIISVEPVPEGPPLLIVPPHPPTPPSLPSPLMREKNVHRHLLHFSPRSAPPSCNHTRHPSGSLTSGRKTPIRHDSSPLVLPSQHKTKRTTEKAHFPNKEEERPVHSPHRSPSFSFHPVISTLAQRMPSRRNCNEQLYQEHSWRAYCQEANRKRAETETLHRLPFEPVLNANRSKESILHASNYKKLEEMRKHKLEALKQQREAEQLEKERKEMEECTFHPQTTKMPLFVQQMASEYALLKKLSR